MALGKKFGIFAWYSYESTQTQKGLDFYKTLVGMTTTEQDFTGQGATKFIGAHGLTFADVENHVTGGRNRWSAHIAVDDVDQTIEKVKRHGGKVSKPAFNMPNVGRMAFVTDPFGSEIGLYTPEDATRLEHSAMGMKEGQICWNDLMVPNAKEAVAFYSEIFGWKFRNVDMGPIGTYHILEIDGKGCGGIMNTMPGGEALASMWIPYITVTDVHAKTKQAEKLGARVLKQPTLIPQTGEFSTLKDPAGCLTFLFQNMGK
jgi:predicted enzyme related to lactoylglutathione lyase